MRTYAPVLFTARSLVVAAICGTLACRDSTDVVPGVSLSFATIQSGVAGALLAPTIQVSILDASGQVATSATNSVTLAIANNPGSAVLSGVTTVNAVRGVATFPEVKIDKSAAGYTLSASSPGLTQGISAPFDITPANGVKLVFLSQPVNTIANTIIPDFRIALEDAFGNIVPTDGMPVTVSITAGLPGVLIGVGSTTTQQGVATFSGLSIDRLGNAFTLFARSSIAAVAPATSAPFNMILGPATGLLFLGQPATIGVGEVLSPSVSVRVTDIGGNTVTTAVANITIDIMTNPGSATLSGTRTVAAVSGVAVFNDLSLDKAGSGYVLFASGAGFTSGPSAAFSVRSPLVFTTIAAGYFHSCGVDSGGNGYCWGSNDGQIGDGTFTLASTAAGVAGGHTFTQVSTGRTHSCGLDATSHAFCWGTNSVGELGMSPPISQNAPVAVAGGNLYSNISAGYAHTCAVTVSGAAYCWGGNSQGELGVGNKTGTLAPAAVSGGLTFTSVSAGRFFTCGVTPLHMAYCWGDNSIGELGTGTLTSYTQPEPVTGQLQFATVGAGGFFSCGLTVNGAAYCWGQNAYGELGAGLPAIYSSTPVAVAGGLVFTSITVGNRHACGLTASGAAYCWGDNSVGSLGNGVGGNSSSPVPVSGGLAFASLSAGRFHTCGVTVTGTGYCWGQNYSGQLGTPAVTTIVRVPVRVR